MTIYGHKTSPLTQPEVCEWIWQNSWWNGRVNVKIRTTDKEEKFITVRWDDSSVIKVEAYDIFCPAFFEFIQFNTETHYFSWVISFLQLNRHSFTYILTILKFSAQATKCLHMGLVNLYPWSIFLLITSNHGFINDFRHFPAKGNCYL